MLPKKSYKLAWIGPEVPNCQTVLDRFVNCCDQLDIQSVVTKMQSLRFEEIGNQDRLVLVAPSRAAYPDDAIRQLTTRSHIVPWAVVTDSWHIGSRRSGEGNVTHWQQPWFRWWDCWSSWFFPEVSRIGSHMASAYAPVISPVDYATPAHTALPCDNARNAVIFGGCQLTTDMLSQQVRHAGWTATVHASVDDSIEVGQDDSLVWDDSLLECLPHNDLSHAVDVLLTRLTELVPASRLITSLDLEHLHLWPAMRERGCIDLLIKPSPALALSNCLYFRSYN